MVIQHKERHFRAEYLMKNMTVASLIAAPLLVFALAMPSLAADPAPTTCKDGTTTTSTGKGTCSGHGGVQKAKTTTPAAAPAAAPTAAPAKAAAPAAPAASGAATTCKDGTTTTSTGKGTCSGHGGVQKPTKAKPATAATTAPAPAAAAPAAAATPASATAAKSSTATKSAPTATAGNTDPTGATAKCKDGTYSKSAHRSGTCSSHGGVAEWLTAAQ
jgi:hypothetical protein